ncbi:hypothetical protein PPSIR1_41214 [Plesiocystis pacifica SIR-1]|uniref:Thioredoxin domain-containing protein n=1 Tax=Plesiocystis pacifica SIR-1 TaxID=391625 RepID=A6GFS0_9BACT|nr:hypothetical protein [Plesiocystis pacifica]EDM75267.1 hypothetical protein PPSIR1_41214 [Plesiocystis pacifica SIR-1]
MNTAKSPLLLSLPLALGLALTTSACVNDDGLLDVGGDDAAEDTAGDDESAGDEGPSDDGPSDEETTDDGPSDEETTDDGPSDDETTDDGPSDDDGETEGETGTESCPIPDPGWGGSAAVGSPAPHFGGVNQFGEEVNVCEYAGNPILIDTSAVWCGPCQMMSMCLGGDDQLCLNLFGGNQAALDALITPMRAEIEAGTFAWVTVLTEDEGGAPPDHADAVSWDENYPGPEEVWVVSDEQQNYYGHLPIQQFPSFWLMDEAMNWQDLNQDTVLNTVIQQHL